MVKLYALAFLYSDNNILLTYRDNVNFGSGLYGLVGGAVEDTETALQAVVREVQEELGLYISPLQFHFSHVFHRRGEEYPLVAVIFKADITGMSPKNNEPLKNRDITWFSLDKLPVNIIPAHEQAIICSIQAIPYSEHGWE